jgi:hypothetical protein
MASALTASLSPGGEAAFRAELVAQLSTLVQIDAQDALAVRRPPPPPPRQRRSCAWRPGPTAVARAPYDTRAHSLTVARHVYAAFRPMCVTGVAVVVVVVCRDGVAGRAHGCSCRTPFPSPLCDGA